MRYRLSEIASVCGGKLHGVDHEVECVITDSRSMSRSQLGMFVAMRGVNHDSHTYINNMSQRGVVSFMVEREEYVAESKDNGYVVVGNSIEALQALAAHHRARFDGDVVAIVGSNGKTIIKEWVAQSVPSTVKLFRSPRSYNSQLGVALSLLMIEGDEDLILIEAGVSQVGEMERLEHMVCPDVVIFSSIGDAHSEGFASVEDKVAQKMVMCRRAQKIIYHSAYEELREALPPIERVDAARFRGGEFADVASRRNSQIVEALCRVMGYATPAFESLRPVAMRMELREGINESIILNDSYNCDINSLRIAIDQLLSVASGRKTTLILSDILQSGFSGEELYGRVAEIVEGAHIDTLIGVGAQITSYGHLFSCERRFFAATDELLSVISRDDYASRAILLKGNRESRFEKISHTLSIKSHTTTLEVDLDALVHNLNYFRSRLSPTTKLTAMVKASSYGAGEYEVAQTLQHECVDYLAVAFADEGVRLRDRGITMAIIVLNADDGSFSQMIDYRLEPEIYSERSLRAFADEVARHGEVGYPIHIKLDTGMHRLGFQREEIEVLKNLPLELRVATIFSHLSSADDEQGEEKTLRQVREFERVCQEIKSWLGYPVLCHILNSAGIVNYSDYQADMCRLGIGLYGFGEGEGLIPISTLKSKIVQIKKYPTCAAIGYGEAGAVKGGARVATIPVGYADGLNRALGCGVWSVVVAGQRAPIVGRICMDSCMVDITHIEGVEEGDEVVIFSREEGNTAQDMAERLGTISYEVLTSVSARVKRIYIKE